MNRKDTKNDDYLWDRSGPPDAEVQKLEKLLGRHRYEKAAPEPPRATPVVGSGRRSWIPQSLAAAVVLGLVVLWFTTLKEKDTGDDGLKGAKPSDSWVVEHETGESSELRVGELLEEDHPVTLAVADIGTVEIDPHSRVRLKRTDSREHRLELLRGKLSAVIDAPPRLFIVDTPSATAVDLGCAYTLEIDDAGAGFLRVTSGAVELAAERGDAYIPGRAACSFSRKHGPGIPYFEDAPGPLREVDPEDGDSVAHALNAINRKCDTLTLWHLLLRVDDTLRVRVFNRLVELRGIPRGATRAGVLALKKQDLDLWRDELRGFWF